ncbi:MAG: family 43 glycosylhydrolase [Bacteroidetes bacterium]|nr:family 43 glycosylhydrolase [Bacteroidota bacterium]
MKNHLSLLYILFLAVLCLNNAGAQNPLIRDQFTADPSARVFNGRVFVYPSHDIRAPRDQFTADPSARVFNGRVYVYPSHDIRAPESFARKDWFCMEDYHVFSSSNLTDWTDHGVIVSQEKVDWVNAASYSMWAPDCIERNGKYYFYFPANIKSGSGRGFGIGVAVADRPEGPYTPQSEPIKNVRGIDPCLFIDKDGQAYIYYSLNRIFAAKLNDNMLELASEPVVMEDLPKKGLVEGPYLFERNGIYLLDKSPVNYRV